MSAYSTLVITNGASYYWQLNDTSGTTAVAAVGGVNGTISGGVTLNQPGPLADGTPAMAFNGTTGKITTSLPVTTPVTVTVEAWVKQGGVAQPFESILSNRSSPTQNAGELFFGLASKKLTLIDGSGASALSTTALTAGVWHYCAAVATGAAVTFYLDGQADGGGALVRAGIGNAALLIGFDLPGSLPLTGVIGQVAIYPLALTAPQVAAHYAAAAVVGPTGPTPPVSRARYRYRSTDSH